MNSSRAAGWMLLALLLVSPAYLPAIAGAQLSSGFDADLTLELSPAHSSPGELVRLTARSTLLDLSGTTLAWYENGKKIAGGMGVVEADVVAGALGSEAAVSVEVSQNGVVLITRDARIRPTELDLLWESDSYAPPFFRGRALPSAGTTLRLQAIPRFKRADASFVPASDITFTWRRNGYVVASVSGRGKSQARLPSPALFGTDDVSVEARTPDGAFEGAASVRIPSVEPVLVLYERHPLFGVMYHQALGARNILPEIEMSFAAVPYFAEAISPGGLVYEWRVNGTPVQADASRPNELTLDARNSTGIALLELALTHATNFFLSATGSWSITLSGGGAGGEGDPFTNIAP